MIVVIGDLLRDIDEFHRVVKHRDGYPVLVRDRVEERPGGAGAVARMVRAMGEECELVCSDMMPSVKRRVIIGDKVVCRIDLDQFRSASHRPLPQADLVLVADYGKGAIDSALWGRIRHAYQGCEIIVDPYPGNALNRYEGATAFKSSHTLTTTLPWIHTLGSGGLTLHLAGGSYHYPTGRDLPLVDQCGAGDCVLATLGMARLRGMDWFAACSMASENAAGTCSTWGAVLPIFEGSPAP